MSEDNSTVEQLKSYFDEKISSLKKDFAKPTKRKRDHEFKYKSNKKQFLFNEGIAEQLKEVCELIKSGS